MKDLMRRDITFIQGVQLEEAVEITRHCYFTDEEMQVVEKEVNTKEEFSEIFRAYVPYWKFERCIAEMFSQTKKDMFYYYGHCSVCNSPQPFIVDYQGAVDEGGIKKPNWRERMVCPNCGCNNRERFMANKVYEFYRPGDKVLLFEQASNLYKHLHSEIKDVVGCEYPGDFALDKDILEKSLDMEDACQLSFEDNTYAMIVGNDVFSLTLNYQKAFEETFRVLKKGGRLFFSIPFDGNAERNRQLVQKDTDGAVNIIEDVQIRNPLNENVPRRVCQIFGWNILQELKEIGFSQAHAKIYFGLKDGYLGYLPLYFEAVK